MLAAVALLSVVLLAATVLGIVLLAGSRVAGVSSGAVVVAVVLTAVVLVAAVAVARVPLAGIVVLVVALLGAGALLGVVLPDAGLSADAEVFEGREFVSVAALLAVSTLSLSAKLGTGVSTEGRGKTVEGPTWFAGSGPGRSSGATATP